MKKLRLHVRKFGDLKAEILAETTERPEGPIDKMTLVETGAVVVTDTGYDAVIELDSATLYHLIDFVGVVDPEEFDRLYLDHPRVQMVEQLLAHLEQRRVQVEELADALDHNVPERARLKSQAIAFKEIAAYVARMRRNT